MDGNDPEFGCAVGIAQHHGAEPPEALLGASVTPLLRFGGATAGPGDRPQGGPVPATWRHSSACEQGTRPGASTAGAPGVATAHRSTRARMVDMSAPSRTRNLGMHDEHRLLRSVDAGGRILTS
jgi:hypothetical protein